MCIPEQNVQNLMLRDNVVQAVKDGKFQIYEVKTIEEGIELLTGVPAGLLNENGDYDKHTVYGKVAGKLKAFAKVQKEE